MTICLQEYIDAHAENAGPRWHTVEASGGSSFQVELIPATITDRILDSERGHCPIKRISRHVRGWRGVVNSHGEELPFSRNGLIALCEVDPNILDSIVSAVDALYEIRPMPRDLLFEPSAEKTELETAE